MKKFIKSVLSIFVLGVFSFSSFIANAQDDTIKTELKKDLQSIDVQEELAEPDGACFRLLPDGNWQVFGLGTGTYDFNDAGDISDATQEALLTAKGHVAKFIKERITTDEGIDKITEKKKNLVKLSGGDEKSVQRAETKKTVTQIKNSADEMVRGIIILESTKIPDGTGGGTVQVKVGMSSKSQNVSARVKSDLQQNAMDSTSKGGQQITHKEDKFEKKKSKSDF